MVDISRRRFLGTAAAGLAVGGAAVAAPSMLGSRSSRSAIGHSTVSPAGGVNFGGTAGTPILAHVRDARTGEISVLSGTREVVIRDPAVVRTLLSAAEG